MLRPLATLTIDVHYKIHTWQNLQLLMVDLDSKLCLGFLWLQGGGEMGNYKAVTQSVIIIIIIMNNNNNNNEWQ